MSTPNRGSWPGGWDVERIAAGRLAFGLDMRGPTGGKRRRNDVSARWATLTDRQPAGSPHRSAVTAELGQPDRERLDHGAGPLGRDGRLAVAALAGHREHVDRELRAAGQRPQLVELVAERLAAPRLVVVHVLVQLIGVQVSLGHGDHEPDLLVPAYGHR